MKAINEWFPRPITSSAWVGLLAASYSCCLAAGGETRAASVPIAPRFIGTALYDGRRALTVQREVASLWDIEAGKAIWNFQLPATSRPAFSDYRHFTEVTLSPDGKYLLTAAATIVGGLYAFGEPVRLWDVTTGQEIRSFAEDLAATHWVVHVAFSPDGSRILTAARGRTNRVDVWDAASGRRLFVLPGIGGYNSSNFPYERYVAFSHDGRRLVQQVQLDTAIVWDLTAAERINRICVIEHDQARGFFTTVAISPDGTQLLTASYEPRPTPEGESTSDGSPRVAWKDDAGLAQTWDANTGEPRQRFVGHTGTVSQASFSPDGFHILTASKDGSVRLWDVRSGKEVRRFDHTGPVDLFLINRDGTRLLTKWTHREGPITANWSSRVSLWDTASGRKLKEWTKEDSYQVVGFSPDGRQILLLAPVGLGSLWDATSGKLIRKYR